MSDNQLLADQMVRWRQEPLLEYSRPMATPFDLLEYPESKFGGRESANTQDWSFMTDGDPSVSFSSGLRDVQLRNQEIMQERRRMPPTLEPHNKGFMVRSLDYGRAVPEVSRHYQDAVAGRNQLLLDNMDAMRHSMDNDDIPLGVVVGELDATPMTFDQQDALSARTAAISHDKRRRMRYPMTDEFGGTVAADYYPPNPPKSKMP